jgi:hypothetical protein
MHIVQYGTVCLVARSHISSGTYLDGLRAMTRSRGEFEMSIQNSVVTVYRTHTEPDQAVMELQRGGVDMHKLSIVGKGYHTDEHAVGYR